MLTSQSRRVAPYPSVAHRIRLAGGSCVIDSTVLADGWDGQSPARGAMLNEDAGGAAACLPARGSGYVGSNEAFSPTESWGDVAGASS